MSTHLPTHQSSQHCLPSTFCHLQLTAFFFFPFTSSYLHFLFFWSPLLPLIFTFICNYHFLFFILWICSLLFSFKLNNKHTVAEKKKIHVASSPDCTAQEKEYTHILLCRHRNAWNSGRRSRILKNLSLPISIPLLSPVPFRAPREQPLRNRRDVMIVIPLVEEVAALEEEVVATAPTRTTEETEVEEMFA